MVWCLLGWMEWSGSGRTRLDTWNIILICCIISYVKNGRTTPSRTNLFRFLEYARNISRISYRSSLIHPIKQNYIPFHTTCPYNLPNNQLISSHLKSFHPVNHSKIILDYPTSHGEPEQSSTRMACESPPGQMWTVECLIQRIATSPISSWVPPGLTNSSNFDEI
jgi:hypothetical protein